MKLKIFLLVASLAILSFGVQAQNAKSKTEPLAVGGVAPDFTLNDRNGKSVTLSKVGKTTVLVFYRAFWCPFCARQLAELRSLLKADENVALFAISPDDAEKSMGLAAKIAKDGKGNINFPLLSDAGHKTIDAYGLFDPAYVGQGVEGIPHPAVYILDKNRKIVWAKVETDYKIRPTNADIRAELDKVK
ncbi:MAG TPA: peroxiredoxin family protein [Pyrinomonadaceae bacterium]|nr:peroxiredoxin family protein [Pyrinomonadaceae bacterium]